VAPVTVLRLPLGPTPVLLGHDADTGDPVELRFEDRTLGVSLIGKRGTGKSSLLEHLILADLDEGTPGMVIDPHGLLAHRVIGLASPEQAERIILLEALTSKPFGLNLLATRDPVDEDDDPVTWAADSVVEAVKKLYGQQDEFIPRLERYLDIAVRTLIPNKGTLADVPRLFRNPDFRQECLKPVTDPDILDEWRQFDSLRTAEQISHTEAVINRLSRMLRAPLIKSIVGAPHTTVPFDRVLNGDTMLIVSLPSERLGRERCNFIGSLLLCAFADRIFLRRTMNDNPRVHLYLDEYHRFATITTSELLEEGRKYGAGVTMAHQSLFQIPDERIRDASRHAGTLIVLQITAPDAELIAAEFPIEPRPEWKETVPEQDGFERELILSLDPVTEIYRRGHSNPAVYEAVGMLFLPAMEEGSYPHNPAADRQDSRFCVSSDDPAFLAFLMKVMEAGSPSRRELAEFIWTYSFPDDLLDDDEGGICSRYLCDGCTEWVAIDHDGRVAAPRREPRTRYTAGYGPPVRSARYRHFLPTLSYRVFDPRDPRVRRNSYGTARVDYWYCCYKNQQFMRLLKKDVTEFMPLLRDWFETQVSCLNDLLSGVTPDRVQDADHWLVDYAFAHRWAGRDTWLEWHGQDPDPSVPQYLQKKTQNVTQEIKNGIQSTLTYMREELVYWYRWLSILSDGLAEEPVRIETSNLRPKIRTRIIQHPRQPVQDAINEFTLRLVTHSTRFMAHIKQPHEYHHTKLVAQRAGTVSDESVESVRQSSQQIYALLVQTPEPRSQSAGEEPPQPPITRRPPDPSNTHPPEDDEPEELA
jgi:hypothetical protein